MHSSADHPIHPPDNLLRLPVRTPHLNLSNAAVYLGISPLRLRMLDWLGAGPEQQGRKRGVNAAGRFRTDDLDNYIIRLYEQADISDAERVRRRQASAATRQAALAASDFQDTAFVPPSDPFMIIATRGELLEQGIFFVLKAMALFGIIMLCISSSPLLKTHF